MTAPAGAETAAERPRIVGVADSDSYVKWAAALLGAASAEWDASLEVLSTPLTVSAAQLSAALAGSGLDAAAVARATYDELMARLAASPPDAVLVAARGPLTRVVARAVAAVAPRAVIVGGLPGISIPATRKAVRYRAQCDLFVVHSRREAVEFAALADLIEVPQTFALASLPFAAGRSSAEPARGGDLVFAAQTIVPRARDDRRRMAALLVRAAQARPDRRVVLKLRGAKGEAQTHPDADPYPELLAEFAPPPNLVVSTAPMRDALDTAEGLVTVSSTAAIEAVARGVPVIALDAFGVSPQLINVVFEGSGLFGGEEDVVARRFRHPDPGWMRDNYLHDPADDDWAETLEALVRRRRAGALPPRTPPARRGGALRDAWDRKRVLGPLDTSAAGAVAYAVGVPLRTGVRLGTRVRRALAGR